MKKHIKILKKKLKNFDPKLKEECGVFGVSNAKDASALTALGLHALLVDLGVDDLLAAIDREGRLHVVEEPFVLIVADDDDNYDGCDDAGRRRRRGSRLRAGGRRSPPPARCSSPFRRTPRRITSMAAVTARAATWWASV